MWREIPGWSSNKISGNTSLHLGADIGGAGFVGRFSYVAIDLLLMGISAHFARPGVADNESCCSGLALVKLDPADPRSDRKRFFLQLILVYITPAFPSLWLRMSKHFFRKDFRAVIKQSRRRGRECVIMILIHFFPPFKAKEKTYKESRFPYVANSIQRFCRE